MGTVAIFLFLIVGMSAIAARYSSLHPLVLGLIAGVPGGLLGLIVAGAFLSPAMWPAGGVSYLVSAAFGCLGAFFGWLRREHLKRNM